MPRFCVTFMKELFNILALIIQFIHFVSKKSMLFWIVRFCYTPYSFNYCYPSCSSFDVPYLKIVSIKYFRIDTISKKSLILPHCPLTSLFLSPRRARIEDLKGANNRFGEENGNMILVFPVWKWEIWSGPKILGQWMFSPKIWNP